jgi:anti-anti-sigma factor
MEITTHTEAGLVQLRLKGRFDFNAHHAFRQAGEEALQQPHVSRIFIDFANVDYLDSSALGMLLILREKAQAAGRSIELKNCRNTVAQVFEIANFGKLFRIG